VLGALGPAHGEECWCLGGGVYYSYLLLSLKRKGAVLVMSTAWPIITTLLLAFACQIIHNSADSKLGDPRLGFLPIYRMFPEGENKYLVFFFFFKVYDDEIRCCLGSNCCFVMRN